MIDAVIFDMDGLLIDSEPMWKSAEKEVFSAVGVHVSEILSKQTAALTTSEVTQFWYQHSPWQGKSLHQVEQEVVKQVELHIKQSGIALEGVDHILNFFSQKNIKIGLATNSPHRLIDIILNKLNIAHYFSAISSAEHEILGKPDPAVYISTLKKLNVRPEYCIAFEDSYTGLCAAHRAGIRVISVPAVSEYNEMKFNQSCLKLRSLAEFEELHWLDLTGH
jgi:beta-phosphoglucomutase-like phosphatase (HAD superfamily)